MFIYRLFSHIRCVKTIQNLYCHVFLGWTFVCQLFWYEHEGTSRHQGFYPQPYWNMGVFIVRLDWQGVPALFPTWIGDTPVDELTINHLLRHGLSIDYGCIRVHFYHLCHKERKNEIQNLGSSNPQNNNKIRLNLSSRSDFCIFGEHILQNHHYVLGCKMMFQQISSNPDVRPPSRTSLLFCLVLQAISTICWMG